MSDFADKVFEVCGFGVATYGEAVVDEKTVAGQIDEFIAQLAKKPAGVDELTKQLGSFFQPRLVAWYKATGKPWTKAAGWKLGFLVVGYDKTGVGAMREVRLPGHPGPVVLDLPPSTKNPGFYPSAMQKPLADLEYRMLEPLALQDAVDLSHFLIRTTIDMQRFSDGTIDMPGSAPSCGGPISTLAVTRRGAEWVDHHSLSTASRPGWAEGAR